MSVYILVKAEDWIDPDEPLVFQSGYIVNARPFNRLYGMQVPPKFVQIEISDIDDHKPVDATYSMPWKQIIDWEFVGHNYVIDGHRLNVFVKPEYVSVSGLGGLTQNMVEGYLTEWGAEIHSIAANSVVFDVTVFEAISSNGFWGLLVGNVDFTETAYDEATGIHSVEADYSGIQITPGKIELLVTINGGTITGHPTNKIRFDIGRSTVFDIFKQSVKEKLDGITYSPRRFKIPQQYVQAALDNAGTLTVTATQFAQYVRNRLDD